MNLIPVFESKIDGRIVNLCDARELHAFLEVKRDFSNWVKGRIDKFGFVEGFDYVCMENLSSPDLASSKSRAQKMIDYHLTVNMAKELSMVENNDQGRAARRYFIAMESRAIELARSYIPGDLYSRALLAEKNEAASFALASDAGKALAYRRKEKKVLVEIVELLREEVQLKLTLGYLE